MSLSDLKPAHFIQSRVHVHCVAAHSAVVEGGGILVEVVTKWEEGEREGGRGERGARGGHLRGARGQAPGRPGARAGRCAYSPLTNRPLAAASFVGRGRGGRWPVARLAATRGHRHPADGLG
jgi:hypothetical protein